MDLQSIAASATSLNKHVFYADLPLIENIQSVTLPFSKKESLIVKVSVGVAPRAEVPLVGVAAYRSDERDRRKQPQQRASVSLLFCLAVWLI